VCRWRHEFIWNVTLDMKLNDGATKWPLRQVTFRHVSCKVIDRPKKGLNMPIVEWLRSPLCYWTGQLWDVVMFQAWSAEQPSLQPG
jgi:asparagine synthase (glutamine-hydrolysing)